MAVFDFCYKSAEQVKYYERIYSGCTNKNNQCTVF